MDMAKNDTIFSFGEIVNAKVRARRLVPNNGKFLFIIDEEVYVCRKGFHALNCQAVVTTELKYVCFQPLHPSNSTELIH